MPKDYLWYQVIDDDTIMQGDLLRRCPILVPTAKVFSKAAPAGEEQVIPFETYDVVVMSQSCDIVAEKINLVLVCPYFSVRDLAEENQGLRNPKFLEKIRRGEVFGYHMLNKCEHQGFHDDFLIVDFRNVFSVPLKFLKEFVPAAQRRLRLLPPYREHLSQSFARFFMRVGLPTDIEPFAK